MTECDSKKFPQVASMELSEEEIKTLAMQGLRSWLTGWDTETDEEIRLSWDEHLKVAEATIKLLKDKSHGLRLTLTSDDESAKFPIEFTFHSSTFANPPEGHLFGTPTTLTELKKRLDRITQIEKENAELKARVEGKNALK